MSEMTVVGKHAEPSLPELAAVHGLAVAGRRPSITEYVRQLWAYRHFIASYANGRMIAQFNTARLGRAWQVLNPIINAAVYYFIFGIVLRTHGNVSNFLPYLFAGVFVFGFTQTLVQSATMSMSGSLGLIRALQFPRASLPLAWSLMQLQNLGVSMVLLGGIVLVSGEPLTLRWLLLFPALLLLALFSTGLGLLVARIGAKVTDLKQVIPFVMRTWMYGSGVMYGIDLITRNLPHIAAQIMLYNPMLVYIELVRYALIDSTTLALPMPALWTLAAGWAVVALVGGFLYFWRAEQEYGRG